MLSVSDVHLAQIASAEFTVNYAMLYYLLLLLYRDPYLRIIVIILYAVRVFIGGIVHLNTISCRELVIH